MEATSVVRSPERRVGQRQLGLGRFWQRIGLALRTASHDSASLWRQHGIHLAAAFVAGLFLLSSHVSVPLVKLSLPPVQQLHANRLYMEEGLVTSRGSRVAPPANEVHLLLRENVVRTVVAEYPEAQPFTYRVESGDTLYSIAARYGLDIRTLIWANESLVKSADMLSIGQELLVLPVDGAYHTVGEGETLEGIAARYRVSPDAILGYMGNDIEDPANLAVGLKLIVPGAALPDPPPRVVNAPTQSRTYTARAVSPQEGSGSFIWPASGSISQGARRGHMAVDIAGRAGDPVVAADAGTVVLVSWMRTSYGYHIIVDHGNGLETLYAHLSEILVEVGQDVAKGEVIGKRGSTGRSTGPHLHFEVRENGVQRNPCNYLP